MSSLDNGLPRFDRLDLSPTKWEPDAAIARQPTPTKPIISKPSRKILYGCRPRMSGMSTSMES